MSKRLRVFQYAKCGTCRKALGWLTRRGVPFDAIDIVTQPPSLDELRRVLRESGLPVKKLFNTSGVSYRSGGYAERLPQMTDAEALEALAADGKLIKRPLVLGPGVAVVGFQESDYERAFAGG